MQQLRRLLSYLRPYTAPSFVAVLLMAAVGALEGFRLLLLGPIFDKVLHPNAPSKELTLFNLPGSDRVIYLTEFIPKIGHNNPLTMVALTLIGATMIKGVCDYLGTYLVNYAGFGAITDLRNRLYDKVLYRSTAFFTRNATGTLVSTTVNDVEKIQVTLTVALAEFLQQFFTLIFLVAVVIVVGHKLAWILLIFIPFVIVSAGRIGLRVRYTTRRGQDKLADIQNILHETLTGNRIVKAFSMELWESQRFRNAARKLFRANLRSVAAQALSSPLMDMIGAVAIAVLLLIGRDQIRGHRFTEGAFFAFIV